MNAREQPTSQLWECGGISAVDSRGGLALPIHPPSSILPPPPHPKAPIRMRVVNLLRLTPGFVPDVYLVCKKCFYLLSKYACAQRVMML